MELTILFKDAADRLCATVAVRFDRWLKVFRSNCIHRGDRRMKPVFAIELAVKRNPTRASVEHPTDVVNWWSMGIVENASHVIAVVFNFDVSVF